MATVMNKQPLRQEIADPKAPPYALTSLMWKASMAPAVIRNFVGPRASGSKGLVSIADFAWIYTEANFETNLETVVFAVPNFKDDALEVGRARNPWHLASSELARSLKRRSDGGSPNDNPDWDTSLAAPEEAARAEDFLKPTANSNSRATTCPPIP